MRLNYEGVWITHRSDSYLRPGVILKVDDDRYIIRYVNKDQSTADSGKLDGGTIQRLFDQSILRIYEGPWREEYEEKEKRAKTPPTTLDFFKPGLKWTRDGAC